MIQTTKWVIYCHTHVASGRRYIGMTKKTMMFRWNRHVYDATRLKRRTHFTNAIRKYGKNAFAHEVLEVCYDFEVASLAERCWIELYDTRNPEMGFNFLEGGRGDDRRSVPNSPWKTPGFRERHAKAMKGVLQKPEVKKKMSDASKKAWSDPEYREQHTRKTNAFVRSPEWREKARQQQLGKECSPEVRAKIAESVSSHLRKVPGHVSCRRHGLVPFSGCYTAEVRGRTKYMCAECARGRARRRTTEVRLGAT